jgi:hypothetical protein
MRGNYYCPDGLMVKLSVFQPVSHVCTGSNRTWAIYSQLLFSLPVMLRKVVYMYMHININNE